MIYTYLYVTAISRPSSLGTGNPLTRSCFGVKNTKEFDCERNTTPLS